MPELPEVETIRRGLEILIDRKIKRIFRSTKKLRIESNLDLNEIINTQITSLNRRARYLLINFSNAKTLIIHLGMSGRITIQKEFQKLKHDHFVCEFDNSEFLIFNDPRRFGFVDLTKTNDLKNHKMLARLACEPLSNEFNFIYLQKKLSEKKLNIKTAMMDNSIVVGVGNIYINESLFEAGISPLRSCCNLKEAEIKKLVNSIKNTIKKAIEMGGSSISDYRNSKGEFGNFQTILKVYGRENDNCFKCNNKIKKVVQNSRSSFYCNSCQK